MIRVGDTIQMSAWMDGRETPEQIEAWKTDIQNHAKQQMDAEGLILGPWRYETRQPGGDQVPEVPDHITGPKVELLIGEADVVGKMEIAKTPGFIFDLREEDLMKLRTLIRRKYQEFRPGIRLTDQQCDALIERFGPEAAHKVVRKKVDVHYS